ncbi:unnamed protein product [Prunus brigantina]
MFGFNINSLLPSFEGEKKEVPEEDINGRDDSSGTSMTTTTTKRVKNIDKSRTLISERRRRGRMKEKLYALRALVPNIAKNSNLTTASESLVLTVTLKVKECEQEINLPNLKLWVIGALLNEGFELI